MTENRICFAAKHTDEDVRAASRSGGVFTALTDLVLENGGVVYGCVLSEDFTRAQHIRAVTKSERDRMRGSKYIPSEVDDCYRQCAKDLTEGKQVLFSGTPCQIEALNCFLDVKKADISKLIRVDILCFSVASPEVWRKFLEWQADGGKIESADFRDKGRFGWAHHEETLVIDGEVKSSRVFAQIFGSRISAPPHCSKCYFKNTDRPSDITLGDYWGINDLDSDFNDNKGVSLVIPNTKNGEKLLKLCEKDIVLKQFNLYESLQPALGGMCQQNEKSDAFFKSLEKRGFEKTVNKYVLPKEKLYIRIARFIQKLIKR